MTALDSMQLTSEKRERTMTNLEEVSGLKKRSSSEIHSRRKKDNKRMLRLCNEIDLPTTEKSVICFHRCSSDIHAFYLFNFSSSDDDDEEEEDYRYRILHGPYGLGRSVLPPIFEPKEMPKGTRWDCSFAALGSNIYHLGGVDFSNKVYCYDTSNPERGWREVGPLIRGGYSPAIAVMDSKIYAMGFNSGNNKGGPWGQVFDPASDTWSPMPELPSPSVEARYLSHLEDEKTILVTADCRKILYGYKVKTNSWVKLDEDFQGKGKIFPTGQRPVAVNRCLYWLGDAELYGYDLDEGELYVGRFGYLDLELRGIVRHPGDYIVSEHAISDECKLISLGGGKLCIAWQHDQTVGPYTDPLIDPNVKDSIFYCIYFVKFQVSKGVRRSKQGNLERILNISIESSKSFILKDPLLDLCYVGAMEGALKSKEETCGVRESKKERKIDSKKSNNPMLQRCSQFSSMEKSICFRTIFGPKSISNFYTFSFPYDEDSKAVDDHHYQIIHGPYGFGRSLLHPIVSGYKKNREGNCAALGSIIYCIGGFDKTKSSDVTHTRKVHCFDTRDPGGDRRKVPSMIKPRFQPHIHTLEGKIYVLGGLDEDDTSGPWMEMFDPSLNKWIGLSSDPYINAIPDSCYMSTLLEDSKTLLVFYRGQDYMHAYDIAMDSWYVYGDKFDIKDYRILCKAVTIDKTLYQYDCDDGIVAYDLDEKKWFRGQFWRSHLELRGLLSQPLDSQLESEVYPILLHIGGGKLCLLWQDRKVCGPYTDDDPDSCFTCVYWIKFRVSKLIDFKGEGILNIAIESSKSFLVDGSVALCSALVMNATSGEEDNEIVSGVSGC